MKPLQSLQLLARIRDTVHHTWRYSLQYSDADITEMIGYGMALQMEDSLIHDMICIGCRTGKFVGVAQLKREMQAYQKIVRPRGYPFLFESALIDRAFGMVVGTALRGFGLPVTELHIHGSSLRRPDARDVDLVLVLSEAAYKKFRSENTETNRLQLNSRLQEIQLEFRLGGLDLLVVQVDTHQPNRPLLEVPLIS